MPNPRLEFEAAQHAIRGARARQEDTRLVWRPRAARASGGFHTAPVLALVADGMGGHRGGEIASETAAVAFVGAFCRGRGRPEERIEQALEAGNAAVGQRIRSEAELAGMGTTMVAAFVDQDGVRWGSVGDSKLWLWRDGVLKRLNSDHSYGSYLDQLALDHSISEAQARSDPRRNALRSALTGEALALKDVTASPLALQPGDLLLLASDGIDTLSEAEIASRLSLAGIAPQQASRQLVEAVEQHRVANQDNTTVVVVAVRAADLSSPVETPVDPAGEPITEWLADEVSRLRHSGSGRVAEGDRAPAGAASIPEHARRRLAMLAVAALMTGLALFLYAAMGGANSPAPPNATVTKPK